MLVPTQGISWKLIVSTQFVQAEQCTRINIPGWVGITIEKQSWRKPRMISGGNLSGGIKPSKFLKMAAPPIK